MVFRALVIMAIFAFVGVCEVGRDFFWIGEVFGGVRGLSFKGYSGMFS